MSDPIQPAEKPILCKPYDEPDDHWLYDRKTGKASHGGTRRLAQYLYRTDRVGSAQLELYAQEDHDLLPLVNVLRGDVRRFREKDYPGVSNVSRELLRHWASKERPRPLFFCQREAVETVIYLAEICFPGRTASLRFKPDLSKDDLQKLVEGRRPGFDQTETDFFPTLADRPADEALLLLRRLGCKMATGSGKTVVMSMLIAWAFCNRAHNPASTHFPNGVLVCCPNLTVKERLQVLRPEHAQNYYEAFDLVPHKYREHLHQGKVLVTNWHAFAPESDHVENGKSYNVVNKGPETPADFARRVLGDLYERMPILVLNDEGHHCWRPAPFPEKLAGEEQKEVEAERREATVWIDGLDRINNATANRQRKLPGGAVTAPHAARPAATTHTAAAAHPAAYAAGSPGVLFCIDLSATPFYIYGSGHPEGRPFPWLVSDFGLMDAIESGLVKIPRIPVLDATGRPEPKYYRLWQTINDSIQPAERLPGRARKPKPDVVYREAEPALKQLAGQWLERFRFIEESKPGHALIPPVLIIVCDNTDIAEVFYRKISGETEAETITEEEVEEALADDADGEPAASAAGSDATPRRRGNGAAKKRTVYGEGAIFPAYFSNKPGRKYTIRIDSKELEKAESGTGTKADAAEELRRIVATVGKRGEPGEHVRCVVSVSMLTEGWDANNVTNILGVRAFGSQLLCEQVVGRGLRRMDYTPDKDTGLLPEEYVDIYGVPFSMIPYKGRSVGKPEFIDKPMNHIQALPERAAMAMRYPVVEGYAFALRHNAIRCDIDAIEPLVLEPNREPTATFVQPQVGYKEGAPSSQSSPFGFVEHNRKGYYEETHPQTIAFQITGMIVEQLQSDGGATTDVRRKVLRLQSRHQLFPQVYRYVDEYIRRKVNFKGCHPCELGLEKYVLRLVERIRDRIEPDTIEGEAPLLPILNRYQPIGTTADVNFKTIRPCYQTRKSHLDGVVADTLTWEQSAAFRLEQSDAVKFYARNDHLGLIMPYEYQGVDHAYTPDFLVRLVNDLTVVLEIKGYEDDETKAKHNAAKRWVSAVNTWGQLGRWVFHVCRDPQVLGREMVWLVKGDSRM